MPLFALALLLAAALLHAGWNVLLKQADERYLTIWLALVASAVISVPILIIELPPLHAIWPLALASAVAETTYYLLLARAYRSADFSLVYPIARGAAPALLALWAILFLGEMPSSTGLLGLLIIIGGLVIVGSRRMADSAAVPDQQSILLPLAVAVCISIYSAIDGAAVQIAAAVPYTALIFVLTAAMVTPFVVRHYGLGAMRHTMRRRLPRAALIGTLSLAAYALVLAAYRLAPVSYAGAVREISVVVGALAGRLLFGEPFGMRRTIGAAIIFAGILLIALAG